MAAFTAVAHHAVFPVAHASIHPKKPHERFGHLQGDADALFGLRGFHSSLWFGLMSPVMTLMPTRASSMILRSLLRASNSSAAVAISLVVWSDSQLSNS